MKIKFLPLIKKNSLVFIAVLIFSGYGLNALAEGEAKNECQQSVDTYVRFIPSRSVDAMSGEIEIIEAESEYSYELKAFDKLPVKLSLESQYISIEDTVAVEFPAHLVGLSFDVETTLPFFNFKETYFRLGLSPSFYGDDWDFKASGFRIPSRYFLIYQPNAKWTFIGGLAVYPDFESEVWPILGFIYKPNDKLTFNLVPERPNITYALNDKVSLFAEGGISNSEFEVGRDGSKNVVLRYKETRLATGVEFKLNKFITSYLSAGAAFNRSLKYRDNIGKVNIKDGFYSEFRIKIEL